MTFHPCLFLISLNNTCVIKLCMFLNFIEIKWNHTVCILLQFACFFHSAQFVRFIHLDMFDCYLFIFTDELIRNIFSYPFSHDEHLGCFSFYSTITNHATMNSCACSTGTHQASLVYESTSGITRSEVLIHHYLY